MDGLSSRSKFTISLVLSLVVLLSGVAVLAQDETQTPSEKVGEGAQEVIEGVLSGYDDLGVSFEDAKSLIEDGVPPGIVVSIVKSLETGHLSPAELESAFKDLRTNVVEKGNPPGLVIKSIKTTYGLPEEEVEAEEKGKPEEAGPPEEKGKNGDSDDEEEAKHNDKSDKADQDEEKNKNGKNEKGDDKGKNGEREGDEEEAKPDGKPDKTDQDEDEGNSGEEKGKSNEAGPPEGKGQPDKG